jgi:hypothetical protein
LKLDLFSTIHQLVKGHPITILADFAASCNGKIVEILGINPSFSQKRTFQMGRRNELISQEPITIQI